MSNVWDVVAVALLCLTLPILYGMMMYPQYVRLNAEQHSFCTSNYISTFFNCPAEQQFQNATGQYCNGIMVCQN